jgi:hypothetical protein
LSDAVRTGFAALDQGDFLDEAAMDARVERLLRNGNGGRAALAAPGPAA